MKSETKSKRNKNLIFSYLHIPSTYVDVSWSDTSLSKVKREMLSSKFEQLPPFGGLVFVKGSSAPIINQLFDAAKDIATIDFLEKSNDAFGGIPKINSEVLLIYNVGAEVTTNYTISGQLLRSMLDAYRKQGIFIIVETVFSKADLRNKYDIQANNFTSIELNTGDAWSL